MHHSMHLCILHHNTIVVFSPTITNSTVTIRDDSGVVVGTHSVSGSNQVVSVDLVVIISTMLKCLCVQASTV